MLKMSCQGNLGSSKKNHHCLFRARSKSSFVTVFPASSLEKLCQVFFKKRIYFLAI